MRRSSRKTLIDALRAAKYDLDATCAELGITPGQLAQHLEAHDLDGSWLSVQAQIDLHAMQRANYLLDLALDEVQDVLRNADDTKHSLTAARMAMDFHNQMSERVQLPAMLRQVEDAMNKFGFDSEG